MQKITIAIFSLLLVLAAGLILIPSQAEAEGLKIILYYKYDKWQKQHPETLKKLTINAHSDIDEYFKKINLSKLPKSKTFEMDVDVGEKFQVNLNSYYSDDGNQASGINHPAKVPEKITVKVP